MYDHSSDEIITRRKFRFVQKSTAYVTQLKLCQECSNFLIHEKEHTVAYTGKHAWPSFVWNLLTDENIHNVYGNKIWQFIPYQWRLWWIDSIQSECPDFFSNVTLHMPPSIFVDITHEKQVWKEDIKSYMLSRLASSCNKYMMPNILCPWGCTEFNHKCGYIPFQLVWQRFLPKCIIDLINKGDNEKVKFVQSARDDYIRFKNNYECWLLNPKWRIKPSLIIDPEKGVLVLTCRHHNSGTTKLMLHVPRQPHHILPSRESDQLCHGVIKSRTIQPLKASTYSISYQMHEQRGTFNGIDTCNITNYGRFDFCSKITHDNECRSIGNRPDINSLLNKLCNEKKITEEIANSMRESSKAYCDRIDFDTLVSSSTYVPLEAAMMLHDDFNKKIVNVIWDMRGEDDNGNPLPPMQHKVRKAWPNVIYPLQKNDKFGAPFPEVPDISSSNYNISMLWAVTALMSRLESLWFTIMNIEEFYQSEWYGWVLTYVSKNCFPQFNRRHEPKDPFKVTKKIDSLYEKIKEEFENQNFLEVFQEFSNIRVIDCISEINEYVIPQDHDIIIIGNQEEEIDDDYINVMELFPSTTCVNSVEYELRVVMRMSDMDNGDAWDGEVYSRHGNCHSHWWHFAKKNKFCTQLESDCKFFVLCLASHVFLSYISLNRVLHLTISYSCYYLASHTFLINRHT